MENKIIPHNKLSELKSVIKGDVFADEYTRLIYATDASAYRQMPQLVVRPADIVDLKTLISFARSIKTSLIPRAAGTSLAGQVVGGGIVADVSKYFTKIIEINTQEHWVRLQPGIVLDELNKILEPIGLFFGPETSTSNRCMIGGMVGNNSCGSHSLIYGSTRDHTLEVKALLSDGSEVVFGKLSKAQFEQKCQLDSLEGVIYRNILETLGTTANQDEIRSQFPDKSIHRRNTGYAIDLLLESEPFAETTEEFNFCKLIAGSEGTLCFITEIKFNGLAVSLKPYPLSANLLECCRQFEKLTGINGVFHYDFVIDERRGSEYFLELNPRLGGTTAKVYAAGYDEPLHLLAAHLPSAIKGALGNREQRRPVTSRIAAVKCAITVVQRPLSVLDYPADSRLKALASACKAMLTYSDEVFSVSDMPGNIAYLTQIGV